ncbi:MAG TPA: helix-turn-helix domain-containing protein [Polyangiaceae bacterium]
MRQIGTMTLEPVGERHGDPAKAPAGATLGILLPLAGFERFTLTRAAPPEELAAMVVGFWSVQWNIPTGERYEQAILPFPCVNLAYEHGEYRVYGPGTERFVATLTGQGWVTGVKFTPAGFSAFSRWSMRSLVDRVEAAEEVAGHIRPPTPPTPQGVMDSITEFLRKRAAQRTSDMELVDRLVARVQNDTSIVSAERLAKEAGISVRSLHRLFERHVGVSTKWIVRRARVQNAAERVAKGEQVDWASVALELGYHDQSHLIRDFREQIGETPAAYAKRCVSRNGLR